MLGFVLIPIAVAGYLYPRLRLVEDELPDAIVDEPPVVPAIAGTA